MPSVIVAKPSGTSGSERLEGHGDIEAVLRNMERQTDSLSRHRFDQIVLADPREDAQDVRHIDRPPHVVFSHENEIEPAIRSRRMRTNCHCFPIPSPRELQSSRNGPTCVAFQRGHAGSESGARTCRSAPRDNRAGICVFLVSDLIVRTLGAEPHRVRVKRPL